MLKFFTVFVKYWWVVYLAHTLINTAAFSQQINFIIPVSDREIPDTKEMADYKSRLQRNPNLATFQFIRLNALASSQADGILKLLIPNSDYSVTAEATHVEYHDERNYEWIGKTDDGLGTVIILSKSGQVSAHISSPNGVFEIFPAPGGLYSLQEIDPLKAGDVGCAVGGENRSGGRENAEHISAIPEPKKPNQPIDSNAKMYPCQPQVNPRVLVLYTPNALQVAGNVNEISNRVSLSISQFNSCIYNSGISSAAALELAGLVQFNEISEGAYITDNLNQLEANVSAQNLRNQYQADLVVLLTGGGYQGGETRGKAQTVKLENSRSYAIVEMWCSSSLKTFAHEVGHLFGCRHENDDTEAPAYAKGYCIKILGITVNRTIMVGVNLTDNQAANRLLHFSNPNVQVGGKASGTNNENNAKRVSESHAIVSGFRPNPALPLAAYVDGPTYVTTQGGKNYELNYSCGSAPYSFSWQYSYDGVNYTSSNITTDVFTWYFYQNQKIYLKGTVTANGKSSTAFIAVTAQMPNPFKIGSKNTDSLATEKLGLSITPNPFANEMKIGYYLESEAFVKLEIVDLSGDLIKSIIPDQSLQIKGAHSVTFINEDLVNGNYLVRLTVDGKTEVKRISIQR